MFCHITDTHHEHCHRVIIIGLVSQENIPNSAVMRSDDRNIADSMIIVSVGGCLLHSNVVAGPAGL